LLELNWQELALFKFYLQNNVNMFDVLVFFLVEIK
jgi:hypothetical protein